MRKLRIAVWHNLPSGGGKRQLHYHIKGLLTRGHYVESWCPETADQSFLPLGQLVRENIVPLKKDSAIFDDGVRVKPLSITRQMLDAFEEQCRTCAAEIARGGFDVLYAGGCKFLRTTSIARYVSLPSAIYLNEPFRWFYEAMPELPWIARPGAMENRPSLLQFGRRIITNARLDGLRLQARAELEYARAFDSILVNSIYSRETVLRTYNLESKVCYLGIDTDLYQPTGEPKKDFVVGLGTIYYGKGVDRAIRAVGAMEHEKRPALVWIGNGAFPGAVAKYRALAEELKVSFTPRMHIPDHEVVSLLSRAKAMIYTSRLEPFGLAPLEANACGTAVVGIAEGGIRESIREGVNGFLAADDNPERLGELLSRFIDDASLAVKMGSQSRDYVKSVWSMERCADNIESHLLRMHGQNTGLKTIVS